MTFQKSKLIGELIIELLLVLAGQESCPEAGTAAGRGVGGPCGGGAGAGGASSSGTHTQREERNRIIRERQNEERQRKLEELKQQVKLVLFILNYFIIRIKSFS